ncbi:hypothetical protein O9H85_09970 [Paenibacillus filicis]|uniref:Uncharacterized protein n=1 Tax=Paenibacillus gyeongsangnamensis TaxID=3388067 RepID=A0ABT4Q786_9BACL|nr:hypothetical protein [Paenibacillus filicis]MCZ8512735.1 hypothetical protein [Paenibacillus filicis]
MLSVHWRLAELWTLQQQRELTEDETSEMSACLHYNAIYARKLAGLYNLSLAASITADTEWQHRICEQIEKLEGQGVQYPEFR